VVARDGTCRQIVHEAKTDQLDTKTTWRGEGCNLTLAKDKFEPVRSAEVTDGLQ
jgi:hypothetical protein